MSKIYIKNSAGLPIGYFEDTGNEIKYWGMTKGLIGRFVKGPTPRWWWTDGRMGPMADIGSGEVFKAEGAT